MISPWYTLLAQTSPATQEAAEGVRLLTSYHWSRLSNFDEPRDLWLLVFAISVLAAIYVYWIYRREQQALSLWQRWLLPGLRLIAIAGAILFFLGPEKRIDRQETKDSQLIILVDTSQSMSVEDEASSTQNKLTRAAAALESLNDETFLDSLRERNAVSLATFDTQTHQLAAFKQQREIDEPDPNGSKATNLKESFEPTGRETRLGDAIDKALQQRNQAPLAGIVIFSDGGSNGGFDPAALAEVAAEQKVPIHTVGLGSTEPRRNLRVQQFEVPSRVYPEDRTTVRGLIHGEGFAGRTVEVELFAREADAPKESGDRIGREQITFLSDAEILPIEFDLEPAQVGRLVLDLRVAAPTDDQYAGDNHREAELEVVEAQTRVLLISSGPTRDYRFLRNQLRRDAHATVDVWLQSAVPGISQDADQILHEFPQDKEVLYDYDCIVAFDPDWSLLDASQVELLENWVAEEAGGLIVVAGPIHTSVWPQNPELSKIKALYPVEFQRRLTLLDDGLYGSSQPWPIDFSREGEQSEFLWLADSANESKSSWSDFAGIFGCYAVKGPKPGARVLGRYSDPDAGLSEERPVYIAEHFYGGGRVLYIGSGEIWRLRSVDLSYFEVLYTKLVRHVSQGRLLRGSAEGQLLVERERYSIGEEVVVRARLTTASREPVMAERVTARVMDPLGKSKQLVLLVDEDRPGNFVGQFDVRREGSYRITLSPPDSASEPLMQLVQAEAPDLEFENTRQNVTLLQSISAKTQGQYYPSILAAVSGTEGLASLASKVESRAEIITRHGTADKDFTRRIHLLLLAIICGALSCEWLLRRLSRLA